MGEVVVIDGKTPRRSYGKGEGKVAIHMVVPGRVKSIFMKR